MACAQPSEPEQPFAGLAKWPVGKSPGALALADLNGDSNLDIVAASEEDDAVSVLLGDGSGRFVQASGSPFGAGNSPNDLAVARIDRDTHLDLAVANHESDRLTILLGDGRGGFRESAGSPVQVTVRPHPHGIAAADFDDDGHVDLVTDGWERDEVEVVSGDGRGAFLRHATFRVGRHPYQRVRAWDIDDDGHADIVTANLRGASVTVLNGNGRGGFREMPGSPYACAPFPTAVAMGDFDGNGRSDLAVTNSPSNSAGQGADGLSVLLADPKGGFRSMSGTPAPTGAAPTQLAVGDIDGDGRDDMVVSNMNSDTVAIAKLRQDGSIAVTGRISVGRRPKGIAVGDLNNDGKPDIAVAHHGDNDIGVLLSL